jgi:large subunit ribosomal protein L28
VIPTNEATDPRQDGAGIRAGSRDRRVVGYPSATVPAVTGTATQLAITPMEHSVASVCDVCGKRPGFGNNVSHSHRRTPRRWNPNIQRVRAKVNGSPRRLYVCTSCIKAGKVER